MTLTQGAVPPPVLREAIGSIVRAAISRRMIAETCPVRSFDISHRLAERDAAVAEAVDRIMGLFQPEQP